MKLPDIEQIIKSIEAKSVVDFEMEFSDFYDKFPKSGKHLVSTEDIKLVMHLAFKAGAIVGAKHTFDEIREILENL